VCAALETVGQLSQTSPRPSVSPSAWFWLVTDGQLSQASPKVSASPLACVWFVTVGQLSQASPTVSASPFACDGFETAGQLSLAPTSGGWKLAPAQYPSPSWSFSGSLGHGSTGSGVPSPSLSPDADSNSPKSTVAVPSALPSVMRALPSASVERPAPVASALLPLSMSGDPLARWKLLDAVLTYSGSTPRLPSEPMVPASVRAPPSCLPAGVLPKKSLLLIVRAVKGDRFRTKIAPPPPTVSVERLRVKMLLAIEPTSVALPLSTKMPPL